MTKPNILLIVADCLRSDYLTGERGKAETPFLDKMGDAGVVFTDMISTMSITTPNFTSILSGLYPVEHGVRFLSSRPPSSADLSLIPHLRDQGYQAYAFMTGPLFEEMGLGHGFNFYECRSRSDYLDSKWGGRLLDLFQEQKAEEPWFILLHLWELHPPRHVSADLDCGSGTPF
jgi:arylsulfatase A-like enzyme